MLEASGRVLSRGRKQQTEHGRERSGGRAAGKREGKQGRAESGETGDRERKTRAAPAKGAMRSP